MAESASSRRWLALVCIVLAGACGPSPGDAGTDRDASAPDAHDAASDAGPVACTAPCEGDSVCAHEGYCAFRRRGDFDPSCASNLTIQLIPCVHAYHHFDHVGASVCNRGSAEAASGRLVRFESAGAVFCETHTDEPIAAGECLEVTCALSGVLGDVAGEGPVRATVSPAEGMPECGAPLDDSMEADIARGCE